MTAGPPVKLEDITVKRLEHRPLEKLLNALCAVSIKLGLPLTNIELDNVTRMTVRKVGLKDWGDERFLQPLAVVLEELHGPEYAALARTFIRNIAFRALRHRLLFEERLKQRPHILDIPVQRPIFVLGFPRTGTTLVQNLLCLENGRRGLQFWELTRPLPFDDDRPREADRAARIKETQREIDFTTLLVPEMHQVHYIDATTVEECWPLMNNTFAVLNFDLAHGISGYGDWLMDFPMEWAYREYKRMLQMLLEQWPAEQLTLKSPEHLWFLDALLEVFPDACIVWTHRNPFDCVASYSSMITLSRRTLRGKVDPLQVGAHITRRFHDGVTRAMAVLDKTDPARFFHADFRQLVRDPKTVVRRIEDHFGLDPTSDKAMQAYLDTPREDARGSHIYSPERYGLERGPIYELFGEYIERFEIPLGPKDRTVQ